MKTFRLTLRPLSVFGTPLAGDTLFGHLCWAVRERFGEARLENLLVSYTHGRPFMAISDAFPSGFVPRPMIPNFVIGRDVDSANRKAERAKSWLPVDDAAMPIKQWIDRAHAISNTSTEVVTQNTINRLTGTTGSGQFAPRQVDRIAFARDTALDCYIVLDDTRFDRDAVRQVVENVGSTGYGRDATTGLGKFSILAFDEFRWPIQRSRHWLTLAPCAPVPEGLDPARSFYQPLTRFGRHGNVAVLSGHPFKRPLLMLRSAAFITTREEGSYAVHGNGLGGEDQRISAAIVGTVHQGYAPLVPLNAELRP